jgi:ribosomal protein S18 acetylase RimI-like enzyme
MNDRYVTRRARPDDYDGIIAVVDDWWGRTVSDSLDRLFLDHFFSTSAVVECEGTLAAFLVALLSPSRPDEAYIHFVGVDPAHRHAGLARRLYEDFFALATAAGRTRVHAITSPVNAASIAFHERMGFTVHGPISDYNQPGTSHVVFERDLVAPASEKSG